MTGIKVKVLLFLVGALKISLTSLSLLVQGELQQELQRIRSPAIKLAV